MSAKNFEQYCRERGLTILRTLQEEFAPFTNPVFLVLDSDGLVKVYKQLLDRNLLKPDEIDEAKAYEKIGQQSFLPRAYGVTELSDNSRWLRLETCYGQTLDDFIGPTPPMSPAEANYIIRRLAEAIAIIHEHGLLYMDIRPKNVIVNGKDVRLIDLGDCVVAPKDRKVITHVHDHAFSAPETKKTARRMRLRIYTDSANWPEY